MAGFKFNLETVLKLKIQMENSVKNEMAKAVAFFEKQKELLLNLEDKLNESILERNTVSRKTTIKNLRDYSGYLDSLKTKIEEQKIMVNHAKKSVDIIKDKLVAAAAEREIFEKLKEKKYQEFLKEEQKKEDKLVDELISFKLNK